MRWGLREKSSTTRNEPFCGTLLQTGPGVLGRKRPLGRRRRSRSILRSEVHTDTQVRKPGGRLSREDQRRIGDILQRVYDEVLRQGVPDRFKELLDQLDKTKGVSEAGTASSQGEAEGQREL